jgi:hypothetical protein
MGGQIYYQPNLGAQRDTCCPTTSFSVTSSGTYSFRARSYDSGCWGPLASTTVVVQTPSVTSITPTSGPVGTQITLNGTGLSAASSVIFNGAVSVTPTIVNDNLLRVIVPSSALSGKLDISSAVCGPFVVPFSFNIQAPATELDWRWVRKGNTAATGTLAQYNRVRTDPQGNFVAAGYFSGNNVLFDGGTNSAVTQSSLGGRDGMVARYNRQGNLAWLARFAGAGDDEALGLAVDKFGYTYITGYFTGTMNVFTLTPSPTTLVSAGGTDMFVAKIHPNGQLVWAFRMGSTGNDRAEGIDIAPDNNFYVAGSFIGNTAIGGLFGTIVPLSSRGNFDAFLAKFSGLASLYWTIQAGGTGNDFGYGVAADRSGGGFLMGSYEGSALFNSNLGALSPINKTAVGGSDGFILGVSITGNLDWVASMGGTFNENVRDVAPDPRGTGLVAVGGFTGTATFGSLGTLSSTGFYDAFAVRLSNTGNFEWVKKAGSFGQDQAYGVRLDRQGNPLVALSFAQSSPIFGAPGNSVSSGAIDALVVKMDALGNPIWRAQVTGTGGDDFPYGVDTASNGGAVAAGTFATGVRFGYLGIYNAVGSRDAWLARYSVSSGAYREVQEDDTPLPFSTGMRIYPNPATSSFIVDFDGFTANIQIYALDGRLVLNRPITQGEQLQPTLSRGTYTVRLITDKGKCFRSRIIIQ